MPDFAFPKAENERHRHLGWKVASIPSSQEIEGHPTNARALFFCEGTSHLARIFDYKWVVVDKGTYNLSWTPYDEAKRRHGHTRKALHVTLQEANEEIERVCAIEDLSYFEYYGRHATPQEMAGDDDVESLWLKLYVGDSTVGWTHSGYLLFVLQKEKIQKKKEIPDADNAVGVDFAY